VSRDRARNQANAMIADNNKTDDAADSIGRRSEDE